MTAHELNAAKLATETGLEIRWDGRAREFVLEPWNLRVSTAPQVRRAAAVIDEIFDTTAALETRKRRNPQRKRQTAKRGQYMRLTDHERLELARAAKAMYAAGSNAAGHLLSAVAAKASVPITQYDRAMEVYRAWLVFGEVPKENPGSRRGGLRGSRGRAPEGKAKSPARFSYRCIVRVPGRRGGAQTMTKTFRARSDAAAKSYCSGLLMHRLPKGARPVSLQRVAAAKGAPARRAKKKTP